MPYRIVKYYYRERGNVSTFYGFVVQRYERRWYWPFARWWTLRHVLDEENGIEFIRKHRARTHYKLGVRNGEVIKVEL